MLQLMGKKMNVRENSWGQEFIKWTFFLEIWLKIELLAWLLDFFFIYKCKVLIRGLIKNWFLVKNLTFKLKIALLIENRLFN
jgi:hypothetical protein